MSYTPSATPDSQHGHVLPLSVYFGVYSVLLVLTGVTVGVSLLDLGPFAIHVALVVATIKAALVLGYFMHLKFENRFLTLVLMGSLAMLLTFFGLVFLDLDTRQDVLLEHGNFELINDKGGIEKLRPPLAKPHH